MAKGQVRAVVGLQETPFRGRDRALGGALVLPLYVGLKQNGLRKIRGDSVSWLTTMLRAASISSTICRLSGKRK